MLEMLEWTVIKHNEAVSRALVATARAQVNSANPTQRAADLAVREVVVIRGLLDMLDIMAGHRRDPRIPKESEFDLGGTTQ
jgi:hypothetical protein